MSIPFPTFTTRATFSTPLTLPFPLYPMCCRRRAGLAENHARASDERAAASERQRGDAQALAAEAVAERDEACRRANVEQGSREASGGADANLRQRTEQIGERVWEQLSLSRAEMAASNEGWDRLWLILGIR